MLQSVPDRPAEAIVVTGKALQSAAGDRASHVDVLDANDLANAPAHELDAILARAAGLQLFRRSDSASGHPTSQGATLRALGGTASSRALLILDGVPQADPFGGWVNWPAYDPAALAEVRVVRGGGSVTDGPGALAGVIEMTSLTDNTMNGSLEAGSRDSLNGRFYVGGSVGGGSITIDAQAARSDGFIPLTAETRGPVDRRAPYREASARARWIAPIGPNVELQASGLGFTDVRE